MCSIRPCSACYQNQEIQEILLWYDIPVHVCGLFVDRIIRVWNWFCAPITGVNSYDIDLQEQKVTITGNVKPDEVLDRISRTGKATSFWAKDDKSEVVAAWWFMWCLLSHLWQSGEEPINLLAPLSPGVANTCVVDVSMIHVYNLLWTCSSAGADYSQTSTTYHL